MKLMLGFLHFVLWQSNKVSPRTFADIELGLVCDRQYIIEEVNKLYCARLCLMGVFVFARAWRPRYSWTYHHKLRKLNVALPCLSSDYFLRFNSLLLCSI